MVKRFLVAGVVLLVFGASFGLVDRLFSESEVIVAKVGTRSLHRGISMNS